MQRMHTVGLNRIGSIQRWSDRLAIGAMGQTTEGFGHRILNVQSSEGSAAAFSPASTSGPCLVSVKISGPSSVIRMVCSN